jgi:hypothetical protein
MERDQTSIIIFLHLSCRLKEIHKNRKSGKYSVRYENHKLQWIETLLQIPISEQ